MTTYTPHAKIIEQPDCKVPGPSILVEVHWDSDGDPLDRPHTYGMSFDLTPRGRRLAQRFARCVDSGDAFDTPSLKVDIDGLSYVESRCKVYGKRANADLRRLGY